MIPTGHYELQFESEDKLASVTTIIEGTFEQACAKANDVIERRKMNGMIGHHVLICPDGRQIHIDQLQSNQRR